MTFERYFRISSYSLIASGFAAIAATRSIGILPISLFAGVYIISLCVNPAELRKRIPSWILNSLALAYMIFFIFDFRLISHALITAAIHMLFFVSALKLLTLSRDRDYIQLYLISFAQVLAASTLTVNIIFAVCLMVFLFCGISTLILFEMRRSNATMRNAARVRPFVVRGELNGNKMELFAPFPAGLFSVTTIGIALLVLILAVPLFFLFPRISRGFSMQPSGHTQFVSGFSDHVELGQIGSIKQSDAVVMRIKTGVPPAEMPPDLKWRGIAFDYFDGRSWTRTDLGKSAIPIQGHYYKLEESTQGTRWLNQTFFIEALPTGVVFAARKVLAVSRDVGSLWKDSAESLYTEPHRFRKLRYSAISDPIRPNRAVISDFLPIPPEIRSLYLQIPTEDPRIAELAKRVVGKAPDRFAKAEAIEAYLRTHYGYSLVLRGSPNSRDPLAMFLFEIRSGHCEYFASSMVIMLRQVGIPARLVNGFRAGEYNSIGNNWIVRQYDAHSWVEAFLPPYGWIEFDPTPTDEQGARNPFSRFIFNLTDAIDLWWWEGIVNYDSSKQYGILSAIYTSLEGAQDSGKELLKRIYGAGRSGVSRIFSPHALTAIRKYLIFLLLLIPVASILLIRRWRWQGAGWLRRTLHPGNSVVAAASFYTEALSLLSDRGYKPDRGQTPLEFAQSLGNHTSRLPFLALTRMYNSIRFGFPGTPLDYAEAQTQLRLLRNSLK